MLALTEARGEVDKAAEERVRLVGLEVIRDEDRDDKAIHGNNWCQACQGTCEYALPDICGSAFVTPVSRKEDLQRRG